MKLVLTEGNFSEGEGIHLALLTLIPTSEEDREEVERIIGQCNHANTTANWPGDASFLQVEQIEVLITIKKETSLEQAKA